MSRNLEEQLIDAWNLSATYDAQAWVILVMGESL